MIAPEILANNTYQEILDALKDDLDELAQKARQAHDAGDDEQCAILHELINEDLDMIEIAEAKILTDTH